MDLDASNAGGSRGPAAPAFKQMYASCEKGVAPGRAPGGGQEAAKALKRKKPAVQRDLDDDDWDSDEEGEEEEEVPEVVED